MDKSLLTPSAPQFSRLEYSLQLALKVSTARISDAYIVSNPSWTLSFDKKSQDIMTIDCWIDAQDLCASKTVDEAMKRLSLAQFPSKGVKVTVGHLPIATEATTKLSKTMVYCRVGLGRAYVIDAAKDGQLKESDLPKGYQSFYLKPNTNKLDKTHVYLICNQHQLLPLFVANFEFDPMDEKRSRERPMCDNCEKSYASVYCSADTAYLCKDCDINLHVSKIASKHQRTQLGRGPDAFGNCRVHQQDIEYFCSSCHLPVCIHCKMVGHHSSGEASKHKLVKVMDAFEIVLRESSKPDKAFESRLVAITKQSKVLQQRRTQVDGMQSALEIQLEQIYKQALSSLRSLADKKRNILLGDELELSRQRDELQQLEQFLEYQRTAVDMYHLLFNWSIHEAMRQNLREFSFFRDNIDVALDLKIDGSVKVIEDETTNGFSAQEASPHPRKQRMIDDKSTAKTAIDLGGMTLKRTSDLFAEALMGDTSAFKVNSALATNAYDRDEQQSVTMTGYEDDYC
eukprot:Partr_v1_DN28122_c2_g1_i2_m56168 putative B-box zinc finger family protein